MSETAVKENPPPPDAETGEERDALEATYQAPAIKDTHRNQMPPATDTSEDDSSPDTPQIEPEELAIDYNDLTPEELSEKAGEIYEQLNGIMGRSKDHSVQHRPLTKKITSWFKNIFKETKRKVINVRYKNHETNGNIIIEALPDTKYGQGSYIVQCNRTRAGEERPYKVIIANNKQARLLEKNTDTKKFELSDEKVNFYLGEVAEMLEQSHPTQPANAL